MNFEKWQALGNDYIIIEARALPFGLTPARIRRICDPHFGVGSDGILLLSEPDDPAYVANFRIFNPDGSESGLSGNGAREAILYLRHRGWTGSDEFSIKTEAGPIHATITGERTCSVQMAPARLSSEDFPSGGPDGRGALTDADRTWEFQHSQVGNPQCSIHVADEAALAALDLPAIGPGIEHHPLFPNRTNVSWYTVLAPAASARGSSSAASVRPRPAAPAPPAPPSPTC